MTDDNATRLAQARARIPLSADQVRRDIADMTRAKGSRAGKIAMARLAVEIGNITPEGKDIYRAYLADMENGN